MKRPGISVLLPTRGRTQQLDRSVTSLIKLADDPSDIQWLFGFDSDDQDSIKYFKEHIIPKIEGPGARYSCLQFDPLGYGRLNVYVNTMAKMADGDWFVFWNDDAVMLDQGWDTVIKSYTGTFCLQAFDTHKLHPYSIFPIVPREWVEVLGHLSQHPLNDAWMSQIAWMLDIVKRIDVKVEHERFDLTGKNNDKTFQERIIYEGNVNDPRDFNHVDNRIKRAKEANILCDYLEKRGYDMSFWKEAREGRRDVWEKMLAADVNNQIAKIKT